MAAPTMKAPPPPPPPKTNGVAQPVATDGTRRAFNISSGVIGAGGKRIVIYAPGGGGKSTLAGLAPDPVFLDVEDGAKFISVDRIEGPNGERLLYTFTDVRECLNSLLSSPKKTVVIDSVTVLESWALAHTLATVKNERGNLVDNVEAYGFGKGYRHLYDTFLLFLADCDNLIRAGKNVILIAHDCTANVPNPAGEDYIRYEPHLQSPKSGQSSIRNRVIQWADYVLFIGYDVITKDGKGQGGGTRTIFASELPTHIAKSRTPIDNRPFKNAADGEIWNAIMKGGK
jgi:hypothetical protein